MREVIILWVGQFCLYYYFCYVWDAHDAIVAKQVPAYK